MYEVIQLMKEDDWLSKTMIMLADDINIFGTKEQLVYIKYWNDEYNNVSELIKSLPPETVSSQSEELKKISRIKDEIGLFYILFRIEIFRQMMFMNKSIYAWISMLYFLKKIMPRKL